MFENWFLILFHDDHGRTHFFSFCFGSRWLFCCRVDWGFVFVGEGFVAGADATECLHCARCEMSALGNISDVTEPQHHPTTTSSTPYHAISWLSSPRQHQSVQFHFYGNTNSAKWPTFFKRIISSKKLANKLRISAICSGLDGSMYFN